MIRSIAGTLVNRFAVMGFALVTVLLNTRFLGSTGQGEVALLNLTILVMLSVSHFITGGAVVYLVPRHRAADFWKPAYLWALLVSGGGFAVLSLWELVPDGYAWVVAALSLCQALFTFHMHVLLGQERIRAYNAVQLTYAGLLAGMLAVFYLGLNRAELWCYATSAGVAMLAALGVSLVAVGASMFKKNEASSKEMFRAVWNYGRWSQLGNVFQTLAYRAPYAILERTVSGGTGLVGIFSIHTYASEAVWNVGKSLSLVQYGRLSNLAEEALRTRITLAFLKISGAFTLVPCVVLWAFPEEGWQLVLGPEFGAVSQVVSITVVGIFVNALTMVVSHHFAGVGKHKFNALASAVGCVAVLVVGGVLIPQSAIDAHTSVVPGWHVSMVLQPLKGAAWAFTAGMIAQGVVSAILFIKAERNHLQWHSWKSDLALLREQKN